jgi:hypothetical protein
MYIVLGILVTLICLVIAISINKESEKKAEEIIKMNISLEKHKYEKIYGGKIDDN